MDQAQEWKDGLKDALDAKARTKAIELAERLAKAGAEEAAYWKKAKQDDVLRLAKGNRESARQIALSAEASAKHATPIHVFRVFRTYYYDVY